MMQQIIDSEQRQRALKADESFIVQAPAGSGKTELLIRRFLELLGRVENPEEIVAITFTRKAAAEMRGRIISAMDNARSGRAPESDAAFVTNELAQTALAQDKKRGWQLEDNPGRLRIQTIDSLCARLTRQMPILANLGAQPETVEDASLLYRDAANSTLEALESQESWSEDIASLFTHLDNDMPKIRDLLSSMLARRDQWLRHVAGAINRDELEVALRCVVEDALLRSRQAIPIEFISELMRCFNFAANNLNGTHIETTDLPAADAEALAEWQLLAELCLTKSNTWRKKLTVKEGFPPGPEHKEMKASFQSLLSQLAGNEECLNALVEIQQLPAIKYNDKEWLIVSALCRLLVLADASLRVLFGERNQIDFTGITSAAVTALGSAEAPTELALQLDYLIKHLLVDEFQDVSITQYTLLKQITAGWAADDGHSLFLVGDPMQSIYRFREAEVGLFLRTWDDQRLGQVPLTPLNITVNFRSKAGIVNWVNNTFAELMPASADRSLGAAAFVPADAYARESLPDSVRLHHLLEGNDELEAQQVVALVEAARKQDKEGTIAILVRGRSHLVQIVPHLRAAGLPFQAVDIEQLGQRPAIQDLLALTSALSRFADRIAWLAILRAPWCGLSLADLYVLAGDNREQTLWQCMQDDERLASLSKDGLQRLLKCRSVLELYFAEQSRRSLRRSVESVWMSLGGPATLQDPTDLKNAKTYFELLEQFDEGGILKQETQFLECIKRLFAAADINVDEPSPLQIMTIHRAKGLEFDTVILPGLQKGSKNDNQPLLRWEELTEKNEAALLLAPIQEVGEQQSLIYEYLKMREARKQHFEEQRLLYVAVTRAKRQLHLLASVAIKETADGNELMVPRKGSLLNHLWPLVKADFTDRLENYTPVSREIQTAEKDINNLRRLTADWQLPEPPAALTQTITAAPPLAGEESLPEYEWAGEATKHIGTVTHRAIQEIAEQGIDQWDESKVNTRRKHYEQALWRLGVLQTDIAWACSRVMQALNNLITDTRGRWILDPEHSRARNEYSISGLYRGRVINAIIDRTFVDSDNVRWIIDYKTSPHEGRDLEAFLDQEQERYQLQLEKYGEMMRHIDKRPIKLGLYYPLLRGWREMILHDDKGSDI